MYEQWPNDHIMYVNIEQLFASVKIITLLLKTRIKEYKIAPADIFLTEQREIEWRVFRS